MKNLRKLLSAFLLFAGFASATAQVEYYRVDDGADQYSMEITDGMEIGLHSAAQNSYYMNGTGTTQIFNNDCVYVVKDAGRVAEDGKKLWYLQQKTTGKYIHTNKLEYFVVNGGGNGIVFKMTEPEEVDSALAVSIALYEGEEDDPRAVANDAKQDLDDYCFILCSEHVFTEGPWYDADSGDEIEKDSAVYTYLGAVGGMLFSTWIDTNGWWIYPASKAEGEDLLVAAYTELAQVDPSAFTAGINPGNYTQEAIDAYKVARQAMLDAMEAKDWSNAQVLADAMKAAKDALDKSLVKIQAGEYYMFKNMRNGNYLYESEAKEFHFALPSDPATVNAVDAAYYWKVAAGDSLYTVQNYLYGDYISDEMGANGNTILKGEPAMIDFSAQTGGSVQGVFNIRHAKEGSPQGGWWHYQTANDRLVCWNSPTGDANLFQIFTVPAEAIAGIEAQIAQNKLNDEMSEILSKAQALYAGSHKYSPSCSLDGNLDDMGLVTEVSKLSTNAAEPTEGPIASLVDNDVATFFHTAWSVSAPSERFICADLGTAVDAISLKMARRIHGNQAPCPVMFNVYGSNDSINWSAEGVATVDWAYDYVQPAHDTILAVYPDSVITREDFVGVAACKLSSSYKYIRLGATNSYVQGGNSSFFYISELRYYAGAAEDTNAPYYQAPETSRMSFEAAIATARGLYSEGKSTREAIDALTEIYNTIIKQIPSTAALEQALEDAATMLEAAEEGEGVIGLYAPGSKATFQAVIESIQPDDTWSVNKIAEEQAKFDAALAAFKAAQQMPEEGKFYLIRNMSKKNAEHADNIRMPMSVKNFSYSVYTEGMGWDLTTNTDTIDYAEAYECLWTIEYVNEGSKDSVYLRNAGTGFYMSSGAHLSTKPHAIGMRPFTYYNETQMEGRTNFLFDLSKNEFLNMNHARQVVTWNDANDPNSAFLIEEVETGDGWIRHNLVHQAQVLCYPFAIESAIDGGLCYDVVGVTADTANVVLVEYPEAFVPAGRPFVFIPEEGYEFTEPYTYVQITDAAGEYIAENTVPEYNLVPDTTACGLIGTLTGTTAPVGALKLKVAGDGFTAISSASNIGVNNGFIIPTTFEATSGDLDLPIANKRLVDIENVVIIPAKENLNVYSIDGALVRSNVKGAEALKGLPAGIYVVNGVKVLVK